MEESGGELHTSMRALVHCGRRTAGLGRLRLRAVGSQLPYEELPYNALAWAFAQGERRPRKTTMQPACIIMYNSKEVYKAS